MFSKMSVSSVVCSVVVLTSLLLTIVHLEDHHTAATPADLTSPGHSIVTRQEEVAKTSLLSILLSVFGWMIPKFLRKKVPCPKQEECSTDFAPVCGTDKVTYTNECMLKAITCDTSIELDYRTKCGVYPGDNSCGIEDVMYHAPCGGRTRTEAGAMKPEECQAVGCCWIKFMFNKGLCLHEELLPGI